MRYIATFDFGTTAVKGVLVDERGESALAESIDIHTLLDGGRIEQDPREWIAAFRQISARFQREVGAEAIAALVMSGQMQDVILVDRDLEPIGNAILYSDGRSAREAEELERALGGEYLKRVTGNVGQSTLVLPKVAWVKRHWPEAYARAHKVLLSPKDLLIAQLTGACCCDATTCSTAGGMDIHGKSWDAAIVRALDIDMDRLAQILPPNGVAGRVHAGGERAFGYRCGMPVYAGIGDAGSSFFACGLMDERQCSVTWGTTGMIGFVTDHTIPPAEGVWNLAAMVEGTYINTVPFLNAGNVHKWISGLLSREAGEADYAQVNELLARPCREESPLFLPYMVGERFPVVDPAAAGCLIGVTPATDRADLAHACLEGVCFSVRQGLEALAAEPTRIVLIGGGARVPGWCQMLADVLGRDIVTLEGADMLPSAAIAACAMLELGMISSYEAYLRELHARYGSRAYAPRPELAAYYAKRYARYLKIYPAVRPLFAKED